MRNIYKLVITLELKICWKNRRDNNMMKWLLNLLERRLHKKKQEVIKLKWQKAQLEKLKKENNIT